MDFFNQAFHTFYRQFFLRTFDFTNEIADQLFGTGIDHMDHEINKQKARFVDSSYNEVIRSMDLAEFGCHVEMIEKVPGCDIGIFPCGRIDFNDCVVSPGFEDFFEHRLDRRSSFDFRRSVRVECQVFEFEFEDSDPRLRRQRRNNQQIQPKQPKQWHASSLPTLQRPAEPVKFYGHRLQRRALCGSC
jgi:hypothetical protein